MTFKRKVSFSSLLMVVMALFLVQIGTALDVTGGPITVQIEPGGTTSAPLVLSLDEGDVEEDWAITVVGCGQDPMGGDYIPLSTEEDTGPYTARPFIRVDPSSVRLKRGERAGIEITVSVPADARDGGRYALIRIAPSSEAGSPISENSVLVPVQIGLKGGTIAKSGEITGIEVTTNRSDGGTTVATFFSNTGNHHIEGAVNTVTVTGTGGTQLATIRSEPFARAVIPGQEVCFRVEVPGAVPPGSCIISTRVEAANGTPLAEKGEVIEGAKAVSNTTLGVSSGRFETVFLAAGAVFGISALSGFIRRKRSS
jgi:hypothetical protein